LGSVTSESVTTDTGGCASAVPPPACAIEFATTTIASTSGAHRVYRQIRRSPSSLVHSTRQSGEIAGSWKNPRSAFVQEAQNVPSGNTGSPSSTPAHAIANAGAPGVLVNGEKSEVEVTGQAFGTSIPSDGDAWSMR